LTRRQLPNKLDNMRYRIASVVGLVAFAVAMSWRSELSSVAARAVMAAIAFSFFGLALSGLIRSHRAGAAGQK
jgi:hypothetical protein